MTLIQNYGLFWREDRTFWGRPGTAGRLLGVPNNNVTANSSDFRGQTGIYVLYADYQMLYVGQAGNGNADLYDRLKSHRVDHLSGRWNQFSWFGLRRVLQNGELAAPVAAAHPALGVVLNHMEAILLSAAEPPLNRQSGRWGEGCQQYLQVRDEHLGLTVEDMIRALHDR